MLGKDETGEVEDSVYTRFTSDAHGNDIFRDVVSTKKPHTFEWCGSNYDSRVAHDNLIASLNHRLIMMITKVLDDGKRQAQSAHYQG